jgi:hypothetical protein
MHSLVKSIEEEKISHENFNLDDETEEDKEEKH